jgi:hypothetical protein
MGSLGVLLTPDAAGQQYEVGVGLGAGTYTGDIIRRIDPTQIGIQGTLFGRRNFDNAWSLRGGITVGRLNGADSIRPIDPVAVYRNAHFRGTLVEASAMMEFHFLDYLSYQSYTRFSPFGFFGLGYSVFFGNGQGYEGELEYKSDNYRVWTPVVPFGFGVKYKLRERVFVSVEAGIRATFSDYLDRIGDEKQFAADEPKYVDRFEEIPGTGYTGINPNGFNFGNSADRDWYYFLGFTISYSFHQVKCFNY